MKLFTAPKSNHKTKKSLDYGYYNIILHLAPTTVDGFNFCIKSTNGCRASCLFFSGHGKFQKTQQARKKRNLMFLNDKTSFWTYIIRDILSAKKTAQKKGLELCVRLNGTSDVLWEKQYLDNIVFNDKKSIDLINSINKSNKITIFDLFPDIQFYDYTKTPNRKIDHLPNYFLTLSRSENNSVDIKKAIDNNESIAVVFNQLPEKYKGLSVIDGTKHDLIFLHEKPSVIGLVANGRAKNDTSGFVVKI